MRELAVAHQQSHNPVQVRRSIYDEEELLAPYDPEYDHDEEIGDLVYPPSPEPSQASAGNTPYHSVTEF